MDRTARTWLAGFLLLGFLVGLPGSLFVIWQYHLDGDPQVVGFHFLALNIGFVLASGLAQKFSRRGAIRPLVLISAALALAGLAALPLVAPPAPMSARLAVLGALGLSGGGLATALLHALEASFSRAPAAALNRAGIWFGSGSALVTILVALMYFAGSAPWLIAALAAVPLLFLLLFGAARLHETAGQPADRERDALRHTLRDLRSVATILFSLLLFFQFGNEWSIAGWLPLFVIHRLGANPVLAILVLAVYFLALMLGRLLAQRVLPALNHRKLLLGSMAAAMCGCVLLSLAPRIEEVIGAAALAGFAFGPIYPLVAERLDHRFSYHPGFYNGTISLAITGGMATPWLLGFVAASGGMRYLMLFPAAGSVIVLILALLIMFEAHLMSDHPAARNLESVPPDEIPR